MPTEFGGTSGNRNPHEFARDRKRKRWENRDPERREAEPIRSPEERGAARQPGALLTGSPEGERRSQTSGGRATSSTHGVESGKRDVARVSDTAQVRLPVTEARDAIVKMVSTNASCIIVGETGSGKTTQVPQFIWDYVVKCQDSNGSGGGIVGCTQPRRVAAVSVAKYVASQRGVKIGGEVGYAVRFDDKTTPKTRIKFMTDGILLRELQTDRDVTKYSCIILDEAHERTLHGDVLFGLLKDVQRRRQNLKIVVMSATLNAEQFSKFWRGAPIGVVHGRSYPVNIFHTTEPQADYLEAAVSTVLQIHVTEGPGDILCFLTGQDEIESAKALLESRLTLLPNDTPDYYVLPLYSALPYEAQLKVFDPPPPNMRKVILATNIAETSITVEGIKYVVDCGVVKAKAFNPRTGMESLADTDISRAQATQRTGRAGRMSEGQCYRLYTEAAFLGLEETTTPEIMRCSLNSVVLQMKAMQIDDICNFEFMDKPPPELIRTAEETLFLLGALDSEGTITDLGRCMTAFPVEPTAARALIASRVLGAEVQTVTAICMIATENVFITSGPAKHLADSCRQAFAKTAGDHASLVNLYRTYRSCPQHERQNFCESHGLSYRQLQKAEDTMQQLAAILQSVQVDAQWFPLIGRSQRAAHSAGDDGADASASGDVSSTTRFGKSRLDFELLGRSLAQGYFLNSAYFDAKLGRYRTLITNQVVHVHPTSVVFFFVKRKPPLVVFNNVVETTQRYMKDVSNAQEEWLQQASPMFQGRASAV